MTLYNPKKTIMKSPLRNCSAIILALLFSCSSNDDGGNNNVDILANYETPCDLQNPNSGVIAGPMAAYWDNSRGTILALTQLPLLENIGGYYTHDDYPGLGFPLPQGYSATDISIGFQPVLAYSNVIGVDVKRNGSNDVQWTYIPTATVSSTMPIEQATGLIVDKMFADLGFNSTDWEVICGTVTSAQLDGGVTRLYSARLIRFGNFIGQAYIVKTSLSGLQDISFLSGAIAVGPINEYDSLVGDIFLPLIYQLFPNIDNGLVDSDLDGTPDVSDPAPNNPNIP